MWKRDVGDAKNTSLLKLGTLGDSLQSSSSLRSIAKKKWFLLQTLEPEKVSGSWGGASQVEASSGEFRVHYFLFLINHFILLAAASQEALGPRKEPAGLLPGSDDRPADVLLSLWAKMLPFNNNLLDKSPVRKKTESNMPSISKWGNTVIDARRRESCSLGGYESPWAPGGAIFIPGEIMTRREYWKPFFFHSLIIFRGGQLMITTSSRSKLASSTSSAPLQVHRGGGNPLNIVPLHPLTILYYYLLIPPALLITILFHVCPRSLVSFRVEEGGNWANNFWRYKPLSSRKCWSSSRECAQLLCFVKFLCFPPSS